MKLTDQEIAAAKAQARLGKSYHEHNDSIRMAYEWLDAQTTIKTTREDDWKHIIQRWCGSYISDDDVRVASAMHPRVHGQYPRINISKRLRRPHDRRLKGIGEARQFQADTEERVTKDYRTAED